MKHIKNIILTAILLLISGCCWFGACRQEEPIPDEIIALDKEYQKIYGVWSISGYTIDGKDAFDTIVKYGLNHNIRFYYYQSVVDIKRNQAYSFEILFPLNDTSLYVTKYGYWDIQLNYNGNNKYNFHFSPDRINECLKDSLAIKRCLEYNKTIFYNGLFQLNEIELKNSFSITGQNANQQSIHFKYVSQ